MVEELAELLDHDLVLGRVADAAVLEHLFGAQDPGVGAKRQRDRVGRPRAHGRPAGEDELGEVDAVLESDDADLLEHMAERLERGDEQIVRERSRDLDLLLRVRDGGGLDRTDPDREESLAADLAQHDDRVVVGLVDPDSHHIQR